MAFDPQPTPADLSAFSGGGADVFTSAQATMAIDEASVLLWLATGRTTTLAVMDTNAAEYNKLINWGILSMAWWLLIQNENFTQEMSGYSGERIGSYSYTKALNQIHNGQPTDVPWFNNAVTALGGLDGNGVNSASPMYVSTERVFKSPYRNDHIPLWLPPVRDGCGDVEEIWVDGGTF